MSSAVEPDKGITLLAEIFQAIGFQIANERSYNALAEHAEKSGQRTHIYRGRATIHGCCWKIGHGIEVWSVLYESGDDLYCADCRPAFRGRYVHKLHPWEMAEYCEDGEALVRGTVDGSADILFELQNLTEVRSQALRSSQLTIGLVGLAFSVVIKTRGAGPSASKSPSLTENHARPAFAGGNRRRGSSRLFSFFGSSLCPTDVGWLAPISALTDYSNQSCENDYVVQGLIIAWNEVGNPVTGERLVWIYVDTGTMRLELLANQRLVHGQLRIGARICALAWVQGHLLQETEISARYEGIDPDFVKGDSWMLLRKSN